MTYHVASETGRLRRVILHRPDLELKRLTPSNKDELLFDDVLWVRRARAEHDGFADVLRDRGVSSWTGSSTRRSTGRWPPTTCGPPSRRFPRGSWPRPWWAG